jgi:hypothetical protein
VGGVGVGVGVGVWGGASCSEQMRFSPQTACIGLACFLAGASYDKLLLTHSQFDDSTVAGSALQPASRPSIPTVVTPTNNWLCH